MRNEYKMDSITVDKYLSVILQDSVIFKKRFKKANKNENNGAPLCTILT